MSSLVKYFNLITIFSYETDHGIAVESTGYLKNAGTPDQVQVMQGSYTYYTPEGVPIITTYIADENGFQVQVTSTNLST